MKNGLPYKWQPFSKFARHGRTLTGKTQEGVIPIFLIQNAWKYITYHKYNSLILLTALVLGFLFPLLAVNDINEVVRDGEVARFPDASRVAVVEYHMRYKTETEMEAAVSRCREEGMFEMAGYSFVQNEIAYVGEASYTCGICSVSEEYLALSGYELLSGTFFSEEDFAAGGERVCLLDVGGPLAEHGVQVGDTIDIGGEDYRVKGIVRAPRIYGSLLLPYGESAALFADAGINFQYQIIVSGEALSRPGIISSGLFPVDGMYEFKGVAWTGEELEEAYYGSMWKYNKYRIQRAAIVIVFAGISLLLLFTGMILRERHDMAVRIALGGSRPMLWLESVIRNLLLVLTAFLVSLLLYPLLSGMVMGAGSRLLFRTGIQVGVCGAAFVVLIGSIVLFTGFRKRNVALLLKG